MRYIHAIVALLLIGGCGWMLGCEKSGYEKTECITQPVIDSIIADYDARTKKEIAGVKLMADTIRAKVNGAAHKIDSMNARIKKYAFELQRERGRIEQVKKYVRIVDNNPSQGKFLRGWVKRAIAE